MIAFTPFGGDEAKLKELCYKLFDNGVIGFGAGAGPKARIRFLLPVLAVTEKHIDEVCAIIEKTIAEMN
jgi:4-aminobutyrate aminotransferase-like enzyme